MFKLPIEVQRIIYSYDSTYKIAFNQVVEELKQKHEHDNNICMYGYFNMAMFMGGGI